MVKVAARAVAGGLLFGLMLGAPVSAAEAPVAIPAPAYDVPKAAGPLQTAVLSGGCFWGVQGVFEHLIGVRQVLSGYAGGAKSTASYEVVSGGNTGHAESVQITYDPAQVSYGQILQVYFSVAHNPTELNRQGPDTGTQYRSDIFYANDAQKKVAQSYIAQLSKTGVFGAPIVTQVTPLQGFYRAEGYHQDYLLLNPTSPYIVYNDLPKIRNFQKLLPVLYQAKAVTVTELKQ
ncbi:MAG TPA: peptide-methionine (S)-S-oxide reductase MsrA [Steroidobacteraceae bacterium]|jgi:peptide-methionine (S)-S-oxide reductase|nr:peptide-methionine (S)-S-oxide reductase MsrA [Steroidobacteraceae bacterium]